MFGDNFPERSHSSVIYPVPNWVRKTVNGMLAIFVDPVTRQKVHLTNSLADTIQHLEVTTRPD